MRSIGMDILEVDNSGTREFDGTKESLVIKKFLLTHTNPETKTEFEVVLFQIRTEIWGQVKTFKHSVSRGTYNAAWGLFRNKLEEDIERLAILEFCRTKRTMETTPLIVLTGRAKCPSISL